MPLRPVRAARRGVIGAPVARTAAVVGTAAVVAHGVNRRQDRREDDVTTATGVDDNAFDLSQNCMRGRAEPPRLS